jgi:uncharacterized protein
MEVLNLLVSRIEEYLKKNPSASLRIIWHGGEPSLLPLDYWNNVRSIFSSLVERKLLTFAVQTNLINECYKTYNFWMENGWRISTSIDGPYELHSSVRFISRKEFDRILSNLIYVKSKQGEVGVVCVVSKCNFCHPKRLLEFFEKMKVNVRFNKVITKISEINISYDEYFGFLERVAELWIASKSSIVVQPVFSDILTFLGKKMRSCDRNPYCFGSFWV